MKRSIRYKMQMKSLNEFNSKHPRTDTFDINIELDSVKKQIQLCSKCSLCELKENKISSGECFGKLLINCLHRTRFNKTILFVGQNPSINRFDSQLRAFTGVDKLATLQKFSTSGDLFRLCLEKSKLRDYDIWVTNLCKCSTEENSKLTKEQIDTCFEFLLREIELLEPRLIVCLGIDVYDNVVARLQGKKIVKVFHPAYFMRGNLKEIPNFIKQLDDLAAI